MKNIEQAKEYDTGYKTMNGSDVGQHCRVGYSIIQSSKLKPSHKLIYAFILSYKRSNTNESIVTYQTLRDKTGYSYDTLRDSVQKLVDAGFIAVTKRSARGDNHHSYNIYSFLKIDEWFAQITHVFLESTIITVKEKEFILLIFPFLLPNNAIGSLNNPATNAWISEKTGLDRGTVRKRLEGLKEKQLAEEHFARYGPSYKEKNVGWKFNMDVIMLDAKQNVVKERNEYYYTCKDYGLLK